MKEYFAILLTLALLFIQSSNAEIPEKQSDCDDGFILTPISAFPEPDRSEIIKANIQYGHFDRKFTCAEKSLADKLVPKVWTVDTARIEALRDVISYINIDEYDKVDPNLISNREIIQKGGGYLKDRVVTVFDDNAYAVRFTESPNYYYFSDGSLSAIEVEQNGDYPHKSYKYSAVNFGNRKKGYLMMVIISTSKVESFMFFSDGKLAAHWIGNKCYLPNGTSCGTRKDNLEH